MPGSTASETQITHRRRLWLYALVFLIVLFLIAPSLLVIPLSFSDSRYLTFPPPAWSMRWYWAYLAAVEWREATYVSFAAAVLTMLLSSTFGTLAAYGLNGLRSRISAIAYGIFILPLV